MPRGLSPRRRIKTRAGDEFPFNITQKKTFFHPSFSSSLDAVDGGGGSRAQKFFL